MLTILRRPGYEMIQEKEEAAGQNFFLPKLVPRAAADFVRQLKFFERTFKSIKALSKISSEVNKRLIVMIHVSFLHNQSSKTYLDHYFNLHICHSIHLSIRFFHVCSYRCLIRPLLQLGFLVLYKNAPFPSKSLKIQLNTGPPWNKI